MKQTDSATHVQLPFSLFVKSLLIGTRFENLLYDLRWHLRLVSRYRHPELMDMHLEERQLPFVVRRLIGKNSNAVDVGSHIGSFLSLIRDIAPNGRHIAFEPSRDKNEWLKKRFPAAEIIASAVGDRTGRARFVEDLDRPGFSHLEYQSDASSKLDERDTHGYEVSICRLDDVLLDRQVDLIKLDIEGGELSALHGAKNTIARRQPSIIFECGPKFALQKLGIDRDTLFDYVTNELKYDIFTFSDFLFDKGNLSLGEFQKCGVYPFRAFNYIALPKSRETVDQLDNAGKS